MGLIYALICQPTMMTYIGQTTQTLLARYGGFNRAHASNKELRRIVKAYGWDAFEKIIIEDDIQDGALNEAEEFWIAYLGTRWPNGYNMLAGGYQRGKALSSSTRKAMSIRAKKPVIATYDDGYFVAKYDSMTAAARAHNCPVTSISLACRKKIEHAAGLKWYYANPNDSTIRRKCKRAKAKAHERRKNAVLQLDYATGLVIERFDSVISAQQNTGASHITEVCNGKRKTSGGFKWAWAEMSAITVKVRATRNSKPAQ